jgi:hypothetical protein
MRLLFYPRNEGCYIQPQQNYQVTQPPAFTNSNVMGSSSDDLYEMMKTLASNIITLQ